MKTETFTVNNLSCANCERRVQSALSLTDGVAEATVSLKDHSATVTYDETVTSREELKETVDDLGYELLLPGESDSIP